MPSCPMRLTKKVPSCAPPAASGCAMLSAAKNVRLRASIELTSGLGAPARTPIANGERADIGERTRDHAALLDEIVKHVALVDGQVHGLGFDARLDARGRAVVDRELVAARALEISRKLLQDGLHVPGAQHLDLGGGR